MPLWWIRVDSCFAGGGHQVSETDLPQFQAYYCRGILLPLILFLAPTSQRMRANVSSSSMSKISPLAAALFQTIWSASWQATPPSQCQEVAFAVAKSHRYHQLAPMLWIT